MDKKTKEITEAWNAAHQLNRIADALDTIIKMVKEDQDAVAAYRKKQDEDPS